MRNTLKSKPCNTQGNTDINNYCTHAVQAQWRRWSNVLEKKRVCFIKRTTFERMQPTKGTTIEISLEIRH